MSAELNITPSTEQHPAPLFTPTPQAARRMLEFFTAQLNNPHTRRAYLNAARRFAAWCQQHLIGRLAEVQPVHVAAFIQDLQGQLAPATVKQHLAALRVLFDWLVTGQVLELNPAHAVRGPKYSLKTGKTPVLTADRSPLLARQHPGPSEPCSTATAPRPRNLWGNPCWLVCATGRSSAPWFTPSPASAPFCV